jgi:hypothetical protein
MLQKKKGKKGMTTQMLGLHLVLATPLHGQFPISRD